MGKDQRKTALLFLFSFLFSVSGHEDHRMGVYEGDLILGGLFPIHALNRERNGCSDSRISFDGLFALEAFYHSLDQLNQRLRNGSFGFTVGAQTFDTCFSQRIGLYRSLHFIRDRIQDQHTEHRSPKLSPDSDGSEDARPIVGVVGPMSSDVALQVANLLGMFRIPQISYAATTPLLSNEARYPYFLRTVPSDTNQAGAVAHILKSQNWVYIVGVYEDSSYGQRGFQEFEKVAKQEGICFAEKWVIDVDHPSSRNISMYRRKLRSIVNHQRKHKAKAVVMYLTQLFARRVFEAAAMENISDHFVWVGTDGWGSRFLPENLGPTVEGAIVSHPTYEELKGFEEYFFSRNPSSNSRNPWFRQAYNMLKSCKLEGRVQEDILCLPENEVTTDKPMGLKRLIEGAEFGYLHFVRDAVFAFGEALMKIHKNQCQPANQTGLCPGMLKILQNDSDKYLEYLKDSRDESKTPFFDNKDGRPEYSIMNYQKKRSPSKLSNYTWVPIGRYDPRKSWNFSLGQAMFKRGRGKFPSSECGSPCGPGQRRRYTKEDQCCWNCEDCPFLSITHNDSHCRQCIPNTMELTPPFKRPNWNKSRCEEFEATVVGVQDNFLFGATLFAVLGLILTVVSSILLGYFGNTPIMKAAGRELCGVLLLGIALCYITVFMIVVTPGFYICGSVRFLYSFSYTVCYAAIFVKMNRIARIFNMSQGPQRKTKYTSPLSQLALCGIIITFQCILNVVWLILRQPKVDYVLSTEDGAFFGADQSSAESRVRVYKFCEAYEDGDMAIALVVPALLLILSAVYGFKARKCPGKFNETRYIIITTYGTGVVWLAFIPVFFATPRLPLRVFALAASLTLIATVTLSCLFGPKLYVAICRPHKNTREAVMGRKTTTTSTLATAEKISPPSSTSGLSNRKMSILSAVISRNSKPAKNSLGRAHSERNGRATKLEERTEPEQTDAEEEEVKEQQNLLDQQPKPNYDST